MTSGVSLWRAAGMSYLQYVNKSANVLRSALKEPIKSKANAMSNVQFTGFQWKNGVRGDKFEINSIQEAAKAFKQG